MILTLSGSSQLVRTAAPVVRYQGFSMRESTGTSGALVRIYDGLTATGTVLEEVSLSPGESAREQYTNGMPALTGIYVQVVSGSIVGTIRLS